MLRTKIVNDAPQNEFVLQSGDFLESRLVSVQRDVKDEKGKVLYTETVEVPKVAPMSKDKIYHVGEDCEMYRFENLQRAGVRLSIVDVENFIKPNLDRQSRLMDLANDPDFVSKALDSLQDTKPLNDVKENDVKDDVKPINFKE